MNKLLQHPTLRHLPYSQLKDPTLEGVKVFLNKRRRTMKGYRYFSFVSFVYSLTMILTSWDKTGVIPILDQITHYVYYYFLIATPFMAYKFYQTEKQSLMSDEQILAEINSLK